MMSPIGRCVQTAYLLPGYAAVCCEPNGAGHVEAVETPLASLAVGYQATLIAVVEAPLSPSSTGVILGSKNNGNRAFISSETSGV